MSNVHRILSVILIIYVSSSATKANKVLHSTIVTYDEVKKASTDTNGTLIIDVREPAELQETGMIPRSINIPLGELESVLRDLPAEQFFTKYGREKPSKNTPMIFSCRSGTRSTAATAIAEKLGFESVENYTGGWLDWEKHL